MAEGRQNPFTHTGRVCHCAPGLHNLQSRLDPILFTNHASPLSCSRPKRSVLTQRSRRSPTARAARLPFRAGDSTRGKRNLSVFSDLSRGARPAPPTTVAPARLKLSFWFAPGKAPAWLPGVWPEDFGDALPKGGPLPNPEDRPRAAAASRACSLARAGPQPGQERPSLGGPQRCQLDSGGASAPAQATISAAGPGSSAVPAAAAVISGPGGGGGAGPVSPQHHELTSLFECPVCFDYVLPPILQCQAGHLVCNQCRQKLSCCPTCRGALTPSIRNLAMEKVASAVLFPCKYATTGCSLTLHHTEKPEHEDICEYRPYSCPCPGASCKWQGSLEAVMSHLMHAHKSITTLQGEDIVFLATDINLPGAVDWVMMQSCFGHHFMLVLEKQEKYEGHQQFFAIVLLIGTRKQAENFAYRLELNGNRRRLTWEATPRSIHDGVAAAIMNSDCLVFDTAIAHLFADNGNLGINVTISTCCP
ncbi:E3 ubiquitin-protein ligase SIAH2 [Suricata suricatta]|uniref:E3 ubiquitin-protein ligase SIAH2 n=1 Tax=Suricata suricatta TaxID=37032 RepID=UPI0011558787|nr:E3 ubiquitin-protein ligase SIAH2 [Suricata suricatta]